MDLQEYIDKKKELNDSILNFIDCEEQDQHIFSKIVEIISDQNIVKYPEEMLVFLKMLSAIANNHHRSTFFYNRIGQILSTYKKEIKQTFSDEEIYYLFEPNKPILLFLIKEDIITLNEDIINDLEINSFITYFYPEIQSFYQNKNNFKYQKYESEITDIEEFKKKREIGENDSYICEIIRNDSIKEFAYYMSRENIQPSDIISPSIFETNLLLLDNQTKLIEYAAFFGSIKIFNYLKSFNAHLSPSLWIYAVHSRNPKMIHLLENYNVKPSFGSYDECLNESFKCFHNEIADYIINNLYDQTKLNSFAYLSMYYNFDINLKDINRFLCFCYFCETNNIRMVKYLMESKGFDIDLSKKIIR